MTRVFKLGLAKIVHNKFSLNDNLTIHRWTSAASHPHNSRHRKDIKDSPETCTNLFFRKKKALKCSVPRGRRAWKAALASCSLCLASSLLCSSSILPLPPSRFSHLSDIIITSVWPLISNVTIFHIDKCAVWPYCAQNGLQQGMTPPSPHPTTTLPHVNTHVHFFLGHTFFSHQHWW